jgi:two-component system chemotaxis response regulator CheB
MARRIVVVGASAGGVEALITIARGLPSDLEAPVVVVLHRAPTSTSALPAILDRSGPLDARHAQDGEELAPGRIYVAPPDLHLLLEDGVVRLARGPREKGHRPAIDPLFRSAARAYGAGTIAVVLSGSRDDGAAGVAAVAERGGTVVVQDPTDAIYPSMPESAIAANHPEYVVPLAELAAIVARLAAEPVSADEARDTEEIERDEQAIESEQHVSVLREVLLGRNGGKQRE